VAEVLYATFVSRLPFRQEDNSIKFGFLQGLQRKGNVANVHRIKRAGEDADTLRTYLLVSYHDSSLVSTVFVFLRM
jgi:hypothetical protein